jgi:hypothetical protein
LGARATPIEMSAVSVWNASAPGTLTVRVGARRERRGR